MVGKLGLASAFVRGDSFRNRNLRFGKAQKVARLLCCALWKIHLLKVKKKSPPEHEKGDDRKRNNLGGKKLLFSKAKLYVCASCKKQLSWLLPPTAAFTQVKNPAEIQFNPGSSFL